MSSEWRTTTWGEVATLEYGKALDRRDDDGPVPVFGTNGPTGARCSTPLCHGPGVIVGRKGAYRGIHWSPEPFWVIDTAFFLNPRPDCVHLKWAYYELLTRDINGMDSGSAIPSTSRADFYAMPLVLPPLDEQRRIAGVLDTLYDKMEHNGARGARMLHLARLEFERWFQSIRDVPRVRVAELISSGRLLVNDGYRAKNSEMATDGVPFLRAGNVNGDLELAGADLLGHEAVVRARDKVSRVGDAFFTAKGTVGRIGRVSRWTPPFVYSPQIAFWRSLDEDVLAPECIYLWLGSSDFIQQRDAVKGQTDMAEYVNLRDQRAMTIPLAPPDRQRDLASVVRPLLDGEALARAETRRLIAIRDALLPKLVSGALRVPDSYEPDDARGTVADTASVAAL